MSLPDADAAVTAYLTGRGPGPVTIGEIAAGTGLHRALIRASIYALARQGVLCMTQYTENYGTECYVLRHVHPEPGEECEHQEGDTDGFVTS